MRSLPPTASGSDRAMVRRTISTPGGELRAPGCRPAHPAYALYFLQTTGRKTAGCRTCHSRQRPRAIAHSRRDVSVKNRRNTGARRLPLPLRPLLPLLAEAVDAERDHVAGLEEFRLRLHAQPDAGRRAGEDHIAGLHHEILRAAPDEMSAVEDHGAGVAALALLAVDVEPHVQALRVPDLVLGDQPRAKWAEGFAALALDPLPAALELEDALGHVVGQAIADDHVQRLVLRQVACALADDDGELDLPVELARILGNDRVVVGPADAGPHLVEDDRRLANLGEPLGR